MFSYNILEALNGAVSISCPLGSLIDAYLCFLPAEEFQDDTNESVDGAPPRTTVERRTSSPQLMNSVEASKYDMLLSQLSSMSIR